MSNGQLFGRRVSVVCDPRQLTRQSMAGSFAVFADVRSRSECGYLRVETVTVNFGFRSTCRVGPTSFSSCPR